MISVHAETLFRDLTQERVRQLVDYDPEIGLFSWLPRTPDFFSDGITPREQYCAGWNARYAGKPALNSNDVYGYKAGRLLGKNVRAHRVAWFWMHGEWPELIDHINRVRSDNRIANLRAATRWQNARNRGVDVTDAENQVGILYSSEHRSWTAFVVVLAGYIQLGAFDTQAEAIAARNAAMRCLNNLTERGLLNPNGFATPGSADRPFHVQKVSQP